MIYEEHTPEKFRIILFLAVTFLLLYPLWQIGDRELYWSESSYAAMAVEACTFPPACQAHGEIIPQAFPLFPWLAGILYRTTGLGIEMSLRLISVASLFLLALLIWGTGFHAAGSRAAAVAVAMLLTSNIILEKAVDGYPDMTGVLFLFGGWMFWFRLGVVRGSWNQAWLISLLCCGLAFYTIGWVGIVCFFVPLIFQRRPLTLWPKLRRPGFYAGIGIVLLFVILWALPRITAGQMPFRSFPLRAQLVSNYLEHIFFFPFDAAMRFLPWSIFLWSPFCVALQPLDANPIFSRFLRTIAISLFVLLWLSPYTQARDIIVLAPPLTILAGCYYTIVIRRYGGFFLRLLRYIVYAAIPLGIIIIVFYFAPADWWSGIIHLKRGYGFHDAPKYILLGTVYGSIIITVGLTLIFAPPGRIPIWCVITMLTGVFSLGFWSLPHPYKAQESSKRDMGMEMAAALESSGGMPSLIYKGPGNIGLYGECYYMGGRVWKISSLGELPPDQEEVFLLSDETPLDPGRIWINILADSKLFRSERLFLWRGTLSDRRKTGAANERRQN